MSRPYRSRGQGPRTGAAEHALALEANWCRNAYGARQSVGLHEVTRSLKNPMRTIISMLRTGNDPGLGHVLNHGVLDVYRCRTVSRQNHIRRYATTCAPARFRQVKVSLRNGTPFRWLDIARRRASVHESNELERRNRRKHRPSLRASRVAACSGNQCLLGRTFTWASTCVRVHWRQTSQTQRLRSSRFNPYCLVGRRSREMVTAYRSTYWTQQ